MFGLLKLGGRVYAKVIPDTKSKTLMGIIQKRVVPDSIVYSDAYHSYNVLDVSEFKHYRINHSKLFADKKNHINGIENFGNQAKRHMRRFNGIPRKYFPLFLKECEWRFNNPNPKAQIKQLKQWVRHYMGWLSRTAPVFDKRIANPIITKPNGTERYIKFNQGSE
jgi:transposase